MATLPAYTIKDKYSCGVARMRRIFFGLIFIFLLGSVGTSAFAQSCAERIGEPHETEFFRKFDWECKHPSSTPIIDSKPVARFSVPVHNGQRAFNYNDWALCSVGLADYLRKNAWNSTGFVLSSVQDPFKGYHDLGCKQYSDPGECQANTGRYLGTLKPEFLPEFPGCPGAEIEPYAPPIIDLKVTGISETDFEDDHFYSVSYRGNIKAGRYEIAEIMWDFGGGETEVTSGRAVKDRNFTYGVKGRYDYYDDTTFHRYDKPILSTSITLTVTDVSGVPVTQTIPVFFSDPEKPIADFDADVLGRRLKLENKTEHPKNQAMTYEWYFGDGASSTQKDPIHVYDEAGNYTVALTVTDVDGDIDMSSKQVTAENGLFMSSKPDNPIMDVDAVQGITVDVVNFETSQVNDFRLQTITDPDYVSFEGQPSPAVLRSIPKNGSIQTTYRIKANRSGDAEVVFKGRGKLATGESLEIANQTPIYIQPDLDIELTTSATDETRAGEEVTITLTINNRDDEEITGIRVDALSVSPHELLRFVSGPTDPNGANPRVNAISLAAGTSTMVTWTYIAEDRGVTELRAFITADRIRGNGRVAQDDSTVLAIESAAIELSQLRIVGGQLQGLRDERPKPGTFSFIRGKIANVGGVDITGINFKLPEAEPKVEALDVLVDRLGPDITPEISLLKPGQANSREFLIPISMVSDVSDKTRFILPVEFSGKAVIDGEDVDVTSRGEIRGNIDRDKYHVEIFPETLTLLLNGFISLVDGIDQAGNETTLGGVAIGTTEGVLTSFQKMGDGLFTVADMLENAATVAGQASADGGDALSKDALKIYNAIVEYNNTTSLRDMAIDLAEVEESITIGGVRVVADYMRSVEVAGGKGDWREVASLISEPATDIGTGLGAERAAAGIMSRVYARAPLPARKFLRGKEKKVATPDEDAPQTEVIDYFRGQAESWDDVPTGVPLTGETVRLAGISDDQYAYMIEKAKSTGGTFIVRPRPETATKWALQRLNAKSIDIKIKSLNEIDTKWLGSTKAEEGLVALREPQDPLEAMKAAVERGELEHGGAQIDRIIDQYNVRRAEFRAKDDYLAELNNKSDGAGIVVLREGKRITTKVDVDNDGFLIFNHNNRRVYSDIDLLGFGKGTNANAPRSLHEAVLKEAAFGIDLQHGAPLQTSDFNDFNDAKDVASAQLRQHLVGGEGGGLIIVGPNHTTRGFVNNFNVAGSTVPGSNYDLYGNVITDYSIIGGINTP